MPQPQPSTVDYRCPGAKYPVSRAVHLGRLARFYPGCRQCPHRHDTGTFSPRQIRQWAEVESRGEPRPWFHDQESGAVYLDDVRPAAVRDMAAALGVFLQRRPALAGQPVLLAGDGRPLTAEMVAATSEGLRWSGCDVVDVGPATSACLVLAVDHLQAAGGIRVANPPSRPHSVGLKFWDGDPDPTCDGPFADILQQCHEANPQRPTRVSGSLRRFQADGPYLACLAPAYHALRPLRIVLDSACDPLVKYLHKLIRSVACQIIPRRTARNELGQQVVAEQAHFAASIDADGET
jgi:phosphomannomutase